MGPLSPATGRHVRDCPFGDDRTRPDAVWELLVDIESWWAESNPEHCTLECLDAGRIGVGTRLRIEESIAGIPGTDEGELTRFEPLKRPVWESHEAHYRFLGLHLEIAEGVSGELDPFAAGTQLTATVWASFPDDLVGRSPSGRSPPFSTGYAVSIAMR